jgi:hypothetical protein
MQVTDSVDFTEDQENDSQLAHDLRAQIKALGSEIKGLKGQNETYRVSSRTAAVTEVLKARKMNPLVANFIPQDVVADADSIGKWLSEQGGVFGTPADLEGEVDSSADGVDQATLDAIARTQATEHAGGVSAQMGSDKRLAELKSYEGKTFDEISALLKR